MGIVSVDILARSITEYPVRRNQTTRNARFSGSEVALLEYLWSDISQLVVDNLRLYHR